MIPIRGPLTPFVTSILKRVLTMILHLHYISIQAPFKHEEMKIQFHNFVKRCAVQTNNITKDNMSKLIIARSQRCEKGSQRVLGSIVHLYIGC